LWDDSAQTHGKQGCETQGGDTESFDDVQHRWREGGWEGIEKRVWVCQESVVCGLLAGKTEEGGTTGRGWFVYVKEDDER
jgi:hypothetical protein